MTTVVVDHVFVCTEPGAPAADRLRALGLTEGSPNAHPGQGTANRRFFFRNAMLELLWVADEAEARAEPAAPLRLWERSRSAQTGAAPFGLCLRPAGPAAGADLPWPTWPYLPPYLPPGLAIPVVGGTSPEEPLLFFAPAVEVPGTRPTDRREPLDHPAGLGELTAIRLAGLPSIAPTPPWRALGDLGVVALVPASEHRLELTFDGGRQGRVADLRPALPLLLRY